jgi:4-hydroxythreonine-4-phosphate dehydrogenase
MAANWKPRVGITMGDPCGIGPEIAIKAALDPEVCEHAVPVLVGGRDLFRWAVQGVPGVPHERLDEILGAACIEAVRADTTSLERGRQSAESGRVSAEAVRAAVRGVLRGELDAIATAPISKEAWRLAGLRYPGHTELLAELGGAPSYGMLFVGGGLRVLLATIHVPLAGVAARLTTEGLLDKMRLLRTTLVDRFGVEAPRIGVAGLNPHAGEGGLFGDEEERVIRPAVEAARAEGIDARGPYPADVLFGEIRERDALSAILAMYHDQGLIPVKQAAFGSAVNVTIGLPFVRTSPDHGTAFDIAGRGVARASSMVAAVRLAAALAARARARANA